MPVAPCKFTSPCLDPSNPLTNYSTEAADQVRFLGWAFPWLDDNNPIDDPEWPPPPPFDPGVNPPPNTGDVCPWICRSVQSQDDANTCSAIGAFICSHPSITLFYNKTQTATVLCSDGTPFTFTVDAGRFSGPSQSAADSKALAYAQNMVKSEIVCLGDIVAAACLGKAYTSITSASRAGSFSFTLVSGSLPPGITLSRSSNNSFSLSGTPTLEGTYTFAIRAVDGTGNANVKHYSICVLGPTTQSLPDAVLGSAYSQSLVAATCAVSTSAWVIASGSLPPGLTLNATTGVISGTPTTPGTYTFTVTLKIA